MNINNQENLKTLKRFSGVNVDFLEFIKRNPEGLKRSSYADLVKFDLGPGEVQPWPTFVKPQMKNQLQEASTAVFHLIKQIPQRIFANNPQKIGAYFGFLKEHVQLQLESVKDGHLDNLLARGDFIFSAAGLKCLEYNVSALIGGYEQPILESAFLNSPFIAKFIREYQVKIYNKDQYVILLQQLLTTAKKKFPADEHGEINIALVQHNYKKTRHINVIEEQMNQVYQHVLKEHGSHLQGRVIFCDFPNLTVDNDCIFYNGKRIHTLVECYHGEVPAMFLYVSLLGNVILYNGPISRLLTNKLTLALLSENEDTEVFTPGEREIIKKYIPWTRRVVPGEVNFGTGTFDMEDFLSSHREKLVIKPDCELGGIDIHVGKFTPADQWDEATGNALRDKDRNWLIQEYVEPLTHLYQYGDDGYAEHQLIWGLIVFGSTYAGTYLRLMPRNEKSKGVINCHQGAKKTCLLEVDK
jgi:hypothetical protein